MSNPEILPIRTAYEKWNPKDACWNIAEYRTPREQINSWKDAQKKKWSEQKKGQKNTSYVTKRGFYMDYDLKTARSIPSSTQYIKQQPWNFDEERKAGSKVKVDKKVNKNTYIDIIIRQQKKHKSPGVGQYRLQKTLKQKEQAIELLKTKKSGIGDQQNYTDTTYYLANTIPGAGQYNPHKTISKTRLNRTDHKYMITKHKKQEDVRKKRLSLQPSSHSYNTDSASYMKTFETIKNSPKKPSGFKGFGSDQRFSYNKKNSKVKKEKRPGPHEYKTDYQWMGAQKKPWNSKVWKGLNHTISVYQ